MAKTLQFRRGTTSELSSVTGSVGELFVNTEKDTVVVMDGSTSGGFELINLNATQTLTNKTLTSPVISTISNTGTLTLPTSTGTIALTSDIPTNNNALTNGAGYITASSSDVLTNKTGNISQWTNNSHYLSSTNINTHTSGSNALITLTNSAGGSDSVTLAAGSNITISESGDTITIASTASGSALTVQDEGSTLSTAATTLNFTGAGVTASGSGSTKTINISGGSSYTDSDVNTHLNTSTASSGEVLSWNGSDYDWVAQSGGGSSLTIQDEGTPLATAATTLNFVGSGVVASGTGSTKTITISGGGGAADLSAVAEDILPAFDEIYDIGSSTYKWYDGFFTNSINLDTISLTNSSGALAINSDVTVGSLLVDDLLLSENTITADASTALQYLGDKGIVEINNSNLDVREGDWIGVPVVETVDSIPPLTTGAEGIIRYNKDDGRFEGYNAEGWASLGGLETNAAGDKVITGNLVVSGDITSTSDETLKDNIKSIESALDIVTKLSGKLYTMKSDETQKEKIGFIAQEIEQHLPQVVSTDPNGIKSVSYGNVTALLVEAIKELNQKIENLKK